MSKVQPLPEDFKEVFDVLFEHFNAFVDVLAPWLGDKRWVDDLRRMEGRLVLRAKRITVLSDEGIEAIRSTDAMVLLLEQLAVDLVTLAAAINRECDARLREVEKGGGA